MESSLFDSPAQTLVNTVNTVGVMGKGIAKHFKTRFPEMFKDYKTLCDTGSLEIGRLQIWRGENRWVLNFPTKTTWRQPSKLPYVEAGLLKFVDSYRSLGIASVSFPPLGCGNGNLDWEQVKPLMEHYLRKVSIPVYIHNVHVPVDFVPEHRESVTAPKRFEDFLRDLRLAIQKADGIFQTQANTKFKAHMIADDMLEVTRSQNRTENIDHEMLEETWLRLYERILSIDSFADDRAKRLKSYLFPILSTLPYVRSVDIKSNDKSPNRSKGLFVDRDSLEKYCDTDNKVEEQGCLSL